MGLLEKKLTQNQDPLQRESAALVLGRRGHPAALPFLVRAMSKDDNLWVRARAAEALGLLGAPQAVAPLQSALGREKDQNVRRMIAEALVRLGENKGLDELTWQLRTGTNHAKAEVMAFLVDITGQPLGQDMKQWWTYLHAHGRWFLEHRPLGSPALFSLPGLAGGKGMAHRGPFVYAPGQLPPWQKITAVVLSLPPRRRAVTAADLNKLVAKEGAIPDDCLLLIQTRFSQSKKPAAVKRTGATKDGKKKKAAGSAKPRPVPGPGLTEDAVSYLLRAAPHLRGVGVDTPSLDVPSAPGRPGRTRLLAAGRLVVESVGGMDQLPPHGTRMLLLRHGPPQGEQRQQATLLAILP